MDNYNFSSGFHGVFSDLYMNYSHNNIFMVNSSHVYKQNINEDFEPLYDVPIFLVVLLSIFYGTISVLAVVGNALVMWIVATSRRMQNVTNCFIANLALADIVIGLFAIPFQFQAALLQRWSLPEFMCAFCPFVQVLTVTVSVFTLTAIAVDRHKAILDPLSARPSKLTAKLIIGGIWAAGGALAAPMAVALRVQIVEESDLANPEIIHRKPFCQNVYLSDSSMLSYRIVLFFLQYLTPLCVISFVYARVALKLWGSRAPGNAQYSRDANLMKNKKKVIKMLFIVVALFAICWLPLQTYNVLQDTFPKINQYRYINIIFFCCDWLAMSNSCYNPFIYGIYNEKFKREFKLRFPGGKKWNQTPTNDSYDMDKTQTLRFSNSFRSHGDWRRSHSSVQFPMVSYSVHFCPHPYESKRTRFLRTTHFNSETSESSYHAKSKLKNVHYSIDNQNSVNNMANKGDKLKMGNSTRFCKNHLQDPKANNAFDSSEDERSLCESKKKSENSGCFRKKKYVNKMDETPRNEMCSKDVLINKRPKTNDTTAYLDGKDNKKKSMEFSASFVNSDSSHSSAGGPYYRGVIVRKPTQMRCFNQTKWDVGLDGENVETEIYIFPEGERNAHGSSDEAISGRVSDELCL